MTKADLVTKIAKEANISKATANRTVDSFIDGITVALQEGDKVSFVGFGTFTVVQRKAKAGRNPRTGAPLIIKAKKVVKFKPGATLSAAVR